MVDTKISAMTAAVSLAGVELAGVQGGNNVRVPASLWPTPVTPINLAQHSVSISINSAQTIPDNTVTPVTCLGQEDWDPSNYWNTGTQRFTPQREGLYMVAVKAALSLLDGKKMVLFVGKNGANDTYMMGRCVSGGADIAGISGTQAIPMNGSTDYLTLSVYQNNGSGTDLSNFPFYTTFSATYMGPTP